MRSTIEPDAGLPHDYGQVCECIDCVGCDHSRVDADDDGLSRRFHVCLDCDREVVLSEPDEDGQSFWEVID
jgi:phage anti-repressor protein